MAVPTVAIALVVMAGIYSFWTLFLAVATEPDRQFARSLLTTLLTSVVAFLFGRASKE